MKKLILGTLVSASLGSAIAPVAMAQSEPTAQGGPQVRAHAERRAHEHHAFRMPSERIEARLAYLKTALKITAEQQPQWQAFASTLRKQAKEMDQRVAAYRAAREEHRAKARPTAIERLEQRQQRLASASRRLEETLAAAKPLYATLSPEQRQIADGLFASARRGAHRGFHRRG